MMTKKEKGYIAAYVAFILFIFLILVGGGIGTFAFTSAASGELASQYNDLPTFSEGQMYRDHFNERFLPKAVDASEQRVAYQLADNGGRYEDDENDVDWDWRRGEIPVSTTLEDYYTTEVRNDVFGLVLDADDNMVCETNFGYDNVEIDTDDETTTLIGGDDASIECHSGVSDMEFLLEDEIETPRKTRYTEISRAVTVLAVETEIGLPSEKVEGKGTADGCTTWSDREDVEEEAEENAKDDADPEQYRDDVADESDVYNWPSDASLDRDILIPNSGGETYESTIIDYEYNATDECTLRDPSRNLYYSYIEYESEYELSTMWVDFTVTDERDQVLTRNGARELEFEIRYTHPLD